MAETPEQNRSEAPTPFKLRRAREKGSVARSMEVGFLGSLVALAAFVPIAGPAFLQALAQAMRGALSGSFTRANAPEQVQGIVTDLVQVALAPLALFGATVITVVVLLEILQLRGFIFTAQPLKPDFSRINPAKGLKRLFSARMLKETVKSITKMASYCIATYLVLRFAIARYGLIAGDGERLAEAMQATGLRLIFTFMLLAMGFAILDQVLVRTEFLKQMRMSRREVTRESREREGDPRIKRRRKQLHRDLVAQNEGIGALPGSDMLIVNPEHFAVALRYDDATMAAPAIAAKGRNAHALTLKAQAYRHGVPVIERPALARALFRDGPVGVSIAAERFEAVAELYIALRRAAALPA